MSEPSNQTDLRAAMEGSLRLGLLLLGAMVLALGHELFVGWLDQGAEPDASADA